MLKSVIFAAIALCSVFLFLSLVLGIDTSGLSPAFWGNLTVLFVSAGVFYGTLTLGKNATRSEVTPKPAGASDSYRAQQ